MKKDPCFVLVAIAILFNLVSSEAQVSLVKDINTSPSHMRAENDYSNEFCACGDYLFFPAITDKGKELWRTDGTSDGTILLKDINVGIGWGFLFDIQCNGSGSVLFSGFDEMHGRELWVSDGTTDGTKLVKDITPGVLGQVEVLGRVGSMVFFLTDHDLDGEREIWQSDGTANNTTIVDVLPNVFSIYFRTSSDTHVFFNASIGNRQALCAINGVNGNVEILAEDMTFNSMQSVGGMVMFSAYDPVQQNSLWSSDGTVQGTVKIKDFGSNNAHTFLPFNDKLIFTAGGFTWISDGTPTGTVQLTDGSTNAAVVIGDYFFGFGSDRLFKSDGTTVETTYLDENLSNVKMYGSIPRLNNKLVLQHYNANTGAELGITDDTQQNFTLLKDIKPGAEGSAPRGWGILRDRVYFLADDGINGQEIWSTDGTAEGTSLLKNIVTGTESSFASTGALAVTGDKLHLLATSSGNPQFSPDLYLSDGTADGTTVKFDFEDGGTVMFGSTNSDLIYYNLRKIYKTNESSQVTLVKDLSSEIGGAGYSIRPYYTFGSQLIFAMRVSSPVMRGNEYWVTDGTEEGTHILKDIYPGGGSGSTGNAAVLGSKLIFDGTTPGEGSELWSSDGTETGTTLLKDINPGTATSMPSGFTPFKNKIIFSALDNDHGREMWITDGTAEGTLLLADVAPGAKGSEATGFTVVGDELLLFAAYDEQLGWCLWKTDGTTDGTLFVSDIDAGKELDAAPGNFKFAGDKIYFTVTDAAHGSELWKSDGTPSGTGVIDLTMGPDGSFPSLLTPINGLLYFESQGTFWRTNGTMTGTLRVADLEPTQIAYLNNWVYFTAPHPEYGVELFKVEFTKLEQQITFEPIEARVMGDAPFVIEATSSSGLPVSLSTEEELDLTGTIATIMKPGTVTITAQQPGDGLFNAAPPVSQTFCLFPSKPVISLSSDEFGQPVLLSSAKAGNQWFRNNTAVTNETQNAFNLTENDTYKVQVTVDGCTSEFSDDMHVIITGVEETNGGITFYPNPATDILHIRSNNTTNTEVAIVDLLGKTMSTHHLQGINTVEQSLSDYADGIYIIMITEGKQVSYKRLVKHR